jgi:DNA helicase-2/ATP-dependent DNA helicase PcrA
MNQPTPPDARSFPPRLREAQERILRYQGGYLAVSAVPGSGKTFTLSLLASELITSGRIGSESEVLVVTVQNSAVDNIARSIRERLQPLGLPVAGYRVCTLHKLANLILRARSDLGGVEEDAPIVDEVDAARLMHQAAEAWVAGNRPWWSSFLPEGNESRRAQLAEAWMDETERIGRQVTKVCKHLRLTPAQARERARAAGLNHDFVTIGLALYALYSHYLSLRGGLDFDDLIWRATAALRQDGTFCANLHARWPFILEDEAQDSSPLQEHILATLAGPGGNWVRVGDPNQSINSTFTSADPRFFRAFCQRDDVTALTLPESGRCGQPIIALANHLVRWTGAEHPVMAMREMAFAQQDIQPTAPGDAQQNPLAEECHIHFHPQPFVDLATQAGKVAGWAASFVGRHPELAAAILCPTHNIGATVVEALAALTPPAPFDDLLRSTPQTRDVAGVLAAVCRYLGRPTSNADLARLYAALVESKRLGLATDADELRHQSALVRSLPPHELLFPRRAGDLLDLLPAHAQPSADDALALRRLAELASRWVRAAELPIDQLLLTIAQDLFHDESDLAICHVIASSLRAASDLYPARRLADYADELDEVAKNRQAFAGLALADAGYKATPGRIAVTTMHKAKGLEWDAVYLLCVDDLEFPAATTDAFRDEPYFMPGRAPAVEARILLEHLLGEESTAFVPERRSEDEAAPLFTPISPPIEEARLEFIAERLRLLYVGITRAKRYLALTWCAERNRRPVRPAAAMLALRRFQQEQKGGTP